VSMSVYTQAVGLGAGVLLLTAVLLVWRRSLRASIRLLAVQGVALASMVAVIGVRAEDGQLLAIAVLVLALKGGALPWVLTRSELAGEIREDAPLLNPTAALIAASLLTVLAYLVSPPLGRAPGDPTTRAVPIGIALVLIGFLLLVTRRRALSQLVGFLLIDNGIAAVAFLTAAGVPLVVELGASLDVLLVVLILQVLRGRMRVKFGDTDVTELTELRD
jgi:hydrogenase-4 component E